MYSEILNTQEKITLDLRMLYEKLGYKKYRMNKFEMYDLYLENKNFLKSKNIITFNDLDGNLLALKPDVTLSIVNNVGSEPQKLYYTENVCRVKSGQFKEIMQVGVEYIGDVDLYTTCEVINTARKSLSYISRDYILDISHLGFISGLINELKLPNHAYNELLSLIGSKDAHEIKLLCDKNNCNNEITEKIINISSLYGSFEEILPVCKNMILNEKMQTAYNELENIYNILKQTASERNVNLDFSIINDMSYYSGLIFQGFIKGIPGSVLSGGRYDNLVKKFGKNTNAIGFAIYFDMLEYFFDNKKEKDVDILLTYDKGCDSIELTKAVNELTAVGKTVFVTANKPNKLRYAQHMQFNERGLEIIEGND